MPNHPQYADVRSAEHALALGVDHVMTFQTWCEIVGISLTTAKRLCASGRGPRITRLAAQRKGVRFSDHHNWLDQAAQGRRSSA